MELIKHDIVDDRVIMGTGTSIQAWQDWPGLQQLPPLDIKVSFPQQQRVCILAPHPDDEILGCGGLIQALVAQGNPVTLIAVTNGSASHPKSTQYSAQDLDHLRPLESQTALKYLKLHDHIQRIALNLPDGQVYQQQNALYLALGQVLKADDILVATFSQDGHPDHEGTGQVAKKFAQDHDLICYEVLIWAWHWAKPNDARIPWSRAQRLDLTPIQQQQKRGAIACFKTQLEADPSTLKPPILSTSAIDRVCSAWEVYLC